MDYVLHRPATVAEEPPKLPGQVVLVFQGGGALGAYQGGVYQALHEAGIEPDWVIGTSIGAINAAIIAGNDVAARLDRLREFWERIERKPLWGDTAVWPLGRQRRRLLMTMLGGIPGYFSRAVPIDPMAGVAVFEIRRRRCDVELGKSAMRACRALEEQSRALLRFAQPDFLRWATILARSDRQLYRQLTKRPQSWLIAPRPGRWRFWASPFGPSSPLGQPPASCWLPECWSISRSATVSPSSNAPRPTQAACRRRSLTRRLPFAQHAARDPGNSPCDRAERGRSRHGAARWRPGGRVGLCRSRP